MDSQTFSPFDPYGEKLRTLTETSFLTPDGKLFDLKHFPTAKSRADEGLFVPSVPSTAQEYLSQREISTILDYTLALSVMRNATEAEVNDVFGRINTFGRRLSDQERRQAGVQNDFSNMVREIACTLRGDQTADVLPLKSMPSISIDLPKMKHGYEVRAEEVFWVKQGILRSTDLRDSMDEQCIADISVCIVGGKLIERSKDALGEIYKPESSESVRVSDALEIYGSTKFSEEFKYCVDEIIKVCNEGESQKLRDIVFKKRTTNAFPSVFAILLITFHELIIKEDKRISDYSGIRKQIVNLGARIETGRNATTPEERRNNINQVKGLIGNFFIEDGIRSQIYGNHATTDIESIIRRSEIELPDYELKQGLLSLCNQRVIDEQLIDKVIKTISAIANNGPSKMGKVIIGVTNKDADAVRIKQLDGIEPRKIGKRFVVGVNREAKALGLSIESYFSKWKDAIKNSKISRSLKGSVLSNIDFNPFYGLGVIVITIPSQKELSYVGEEEIYWRNGDATELAKTPKQIAMLAQRF